MVPSAIGNQTGGSLIRPASFNGVYGFKRLPWNRYDGAGIANARDLRATIDQGGPFHYSRDGVVFGNRERILPSMPRGYYHEYTVRTPGARDRAARRMVCGGPRTTPEVCYYSDDHYQSFRRVRP